MKTALPRRAVWLGAVIAAFAALAVWADGELDLTFAPPNGVATIAFANAPRAYLHAVQTRADGTIEAAGFAEPDGLPSAATPAPDILIARLSSTGTLLSAQTISQAVNKAVINGPAGVVIASQTGDVFIVGSNAGGNGLLNATVYWLDSAGKVLASYTRPATAQADQSACLGFHPILDSQGRLVAACVYGDTSGTLQLAALRLSPRTTNYKGTITHKLVPDPTFGPNGFAIVATFPAAYTFAGGTAITQDANSGAYYVGGFACAGNCLTATANSPVAQFVARLAGADGGLDASYGTAGFAVAFAPAATGGNPEDITLDNAGKVVIGGNFSTAGSANGTGYVARLTSAGTRDSGFGTNGVVQGLTGSEVIAVRTDAVNQVYALDHGTRLFRLTSSGAPDGGFAAAANVQTLNGAGSAWQTMQFVDSNQLSVYIAGGVSATCTMSCAASAVIAKVSLVTKATTTSVASDLNPSSDGSLVTFTARVSGLTGASPGGNVTFNDGAMAFGTAPVAAGMATLTTSSLSVGYHNITAIYGGDPNNSPSVSPPLIQTVNASTVAPSATALTLTPDTISAGQSVTLSATVTGTNPTGAVTFNEGTNALGTSLLVNGTASLGIDVLTVGSHDLIASYSGDVNNMPSDSAPATVTVTMAASATALALMPATSTDGQSVTLTATVTGVAGLSPTGTVSFKDGTTALGTAALMMDGTATFSTTALTVGTHSLTADYGGDGNFNPSTSAAATAMVNAKPVTPSGSSGGGGGGGFGLLELCALLLLIVVRAHRSRARTQGTIQSPSAMMRVPFASAKCTTYPPLEAKRWPGASVRRG